MAIKQSANSKVVIYLMLIIGAAMFSFPFVDMVMTSIKLDDELATDTYRLLPKVPYARWQSPYVNQDGDERIRKPNDLPADLWTAFEPELRKTVRARVDAFLADDPQVKALFVSIDKEQAARELTDVVGARVLGRISDKARAAGVPAMLEDVKQLCDDETLAGAFAMYVPRAVLGEVRVRLANYARQTVAKPEDWRVVSGPVTLKPTVAPLEPGTLLQTNFSSTGDAAVIAASGRDITVEQARTIDRVFVAFQEDRSWARINLRVIRDGKLYGLAEPLYMDEIRWGEIELRWPDPANEPVSGRTYYRLAEIGTAPPSSPAFGVEFELLPNSGVGAWWAKISRNYQTAFRQVPIARYFLTSVALAILNIVLTIFASSFAAYAFARLEWPGREFFFGLLLATMMVPGQVTMIPTFLVYREIGFYNTLLPLWLPSAFGSAFFIFMMRQFMKTMPKELEEAARIDGCGFLRTYWHIMLPLVKPSLAAVAMFSFLGSWNNFMGPLIYVNDERMYNMAFGLFRFQLMSGASNSLMMAGAFVMTLPIIFIFFTFQRVFVQGITLSGVGGR